jgi:hypothetical protein
MTRDRLLELELSALDQLKNGHADDRLGHRRDPEHRVSPARWRRAGVDEHWKQAVETWQDLEKWMEWSARCNVSTLHNGTIVQARW